MLKDEAEIARDAFLQGFKVLGRAMLQRGIVVQPLKGNEGVKGEEKYWEMIAKAVDREVACGSDVIEALETARNLVSVMLRTVVAAELIK
jgi:hypothetical protein